ncbi:MAG TPA: hypothetical protein VMT46_18165 [Anaerolineaceae bacterium]|nr:hypothetical protein [Anaerolineaceae bacterium]
MGQFFDVKWPWIEASHGQRDVLLSGLNDADLVFVPGEQPILRPTGNTFSPGDQVDIYVQAMMVFFGKAVVYFRTMNKPLPPSIEEYIA